MNRTRWLGAIAAVIALAVGLMSSAGTVSAATPGGTIQGTGGGTFVVGSPITMSYSLLSTPNPYTGFQIGVVYSDATVGGALTNSSTSVSVWGYVGATFPPAPILSNSLSGLLLAPLRADIIGNVGLAGPTSVVGPLGTITWTATNAGVTAVHMISFGAPDNGGAGAGTFTIDTASAAMANTLACGDGGAFTSAAGYCGPLPVPGSVAADSVFNIVPQPPILSVTKTPSVTSLVAGQSMSFALTVTNAATPATTATGVTLTDTLNAAFLGGPVTFSGPGAGSCTFTSPTVTCTVGSLAPAASFNVTVNVTTTGTSGGASYTNKACANDTNLPPLGQVCSSVVTINVIPPAVAWSKTPTSANIFLAENATPPTTGTFTFDEVMTNQGDLKGLGAFSFTLHYDPTQYTAPAIDMSPAIALFAASGRTLTCNIGPAFNGMINVACASTGTFGVGPVWVGPKVMAHVTLTLQAFVLQSIRPNKENGDLSWVKDDQVTVSNTCGQPLNDGTIQPLPGQPECQGALLQGVGPGGVLTGNPNGGESTQTWRRLEGDVTKDCKVDVADMQLEASKYGTGVGSLLYSLFYDVNTPYLTGDGRIDIQDIQFIYGRSGSTCATPIPTQP